MFAKIAQRIADDEILKLTAVFVAMGNQVVKLKPKALRSGMLIAGVKYVS
jgi:hypothetical protein